MTDEQYFELKKNIEAIGNWLFLYSLVIMIAMVRSCDKVDTIKDLLEQQAQTEQPAQEVQQ